MGGPSATVLWKDPEHPGTDNITAAGIALAGRHFAEICPNLERWKIELVVNMAASDWRSGNEDRAFTALRHYMDLTGAYRVVAAMRAGSQDG